MSSFEQVCRNGSLPVDSETSRDNPVTPNAEGFLIESSAGGDDGGLVLGGVHTRATIGREEKFGEK
jgi:hypothetical protein